MAYTSNNSLTIRESQYGTGYKNLPARSIAYVTGNNTPNPAVGPFFPIAGSAITTYPFELQLIGNTVYAERGLGDNTSVILTDQNSANWAVPINTPITPVWINITSSWTCPTPQTLASKYPTAIMAERIYAQLSLVAVGVGGARLGTEVGAGYYNAGANPSPSTSFNTSQLYRNSDGEVEFECQLYDLTAGAAVAGTYTKMRSGATYLSIMSDCPVAVPVNLQLTPGSQYIIQARKSLAEVNLGSTSNVIIKGAKILAHLQF